MGTSLSAAVAAPIQVVSNSKSWSFSPLTIGNFGQLEQWARSKVVEIAAKACENVKDAIAAKIMEAAFNKAATICFMATASDGEAKAATESLMSSIDGINQILYLSLLKVHGVVDLPTIEGIVNDPNTNVRELIDSIMKASGQSFFRQQIDSK